MPASDSMTSILGRPIEGICRILLRHERRRRFRWMGVVEIILGLILCICLIPILLIAALSGSDMDIELPSFSGRLWHRWHELVLVMLDASGETLATARQAPESQEEGERITAAVLAAADRQGVMVLETIGESVAEIVEVWYGGQPLLSHPERRDVAVLSHRLRGAGLDVTEEPARMVLSQPLPTMGRVASAVVLVVLYLPLTLLLFWSPRWRVALQEMVMNARGESPGRREVVVTAEAITGRSVRGERVWGETRVDGYELLGLTFSPTLSYSGEIRRSPATLRCIGQHHTITMPMSVDPAQGSVLRDWLVATSLQLRAEKPELGLAGDGPRPTRCPYCATLYIFKPGVPCPSCGGWPEQLSL
jgi:hypothetical protein